MPQPVDAFQRARRFYREAAVAPADGGFQILLDGRLARSPGAAPLRAPTAALAELIAAEWRAQGDAIDYDTMPATRLAHTALDGVRIARTQTAATVARYAAHDLILYFAEHPRGLVALQEATWGPLITWAEETFGVEFIRAAGIVHQPQPLASVARVEALAAEAEDFALAGLAFGAALFGSALLVLALRVGRLDGAGAFAAARLDETFQAEVWGRDAEADGAALKLERDALMLERWFAALP